MPQDDTGRRWAVVGGGMLGMATARRLATAGQHVTLYESAPSLGGLASAWSLPGEEGAVTWDRFYHVILGTDQRLLTLLDELGLGDEVRWAKSQAACYTGGRALPASSARELLSLPFLGPVAKARIALNCAWGALWRTGPRFERLTAVDWLRRWSGRQATDRLWLPLLRAKLGTRAEEAAASFIQATIRRLGTARRQGGDADLFGHVAGGYAQVHDALAKDLAERGVEVRLGARVREVTAELEVHLVDGGSQRYDRVVVTAASPLAARLCPSLSEHETERLTSVPYLGVLCPSVLLRKPVTGAYITYLTDPAPFTAVIETTALVDRAELGGHTLVYLPRYTDPDDEAFRTADETLREQFLPAFLAMYPKLTAEDVVSFTVARARYVLPVPTVGYSDRVPAVRTSIPGLYTVGSAQITDGTLNVESTLTLLDRAWPHLDVPSAQPQEAPR